ncbi:Uma2 family endonuclease [Saccharopolyspora sp. TS4A08]|uniref:Uma2 family endonuclease n=1 Tax=Saccharopolyspora ipomoeae TaxID=3042027 RepID=A0ABT6PV48_9PSEU|nr:Uma2 family endonuclease [Saccharopolyspora sp. TS4A08]MDI2031523.1 Uma2 family endonuclease [Saccharopolyspora sp. TS4A08]
MTALVQHELGPFTIADWHALPAREDGSRLELIEGNWLVTPPPSGYHQWAEKRIIAAFDRAIEQAGRADELFAVSGVGVEISTTYRSALIPDFVVLNRPPAGNTFQAADVLLIGEIWSPGNTHTEQQEKFHACERAGVQYFWSVAQDVGGPCELAAYRLDNGRYSLVTTASRGQGPVHVDAAPAPLAVDVDALRL